MSTDTPMPSAPEIPTTSSHTSSRADWDYGNNRNGDAAERLDSKDDESAAQSSTLTKPLSSNTSYAFSGPALGTCSTESISGKESKAGGGEDKTGAGEKSENTKDEDKNDDSVYECNICLDTAKDAVVSLCGHLFCWPCLHQWLQTRPHRKLCPVCKAAISKEKVIPLYGRNSSKQQDPRNKVPPRPAGQRTEPEPFQGFPGFGFGDGFYMSFGIGSFPFAYFTSSFNLWDNQPAANRGTAQYEDEQQLSKLFLYLAFLCIAWLLFA